VTAAGGEGAVRVVVGDHTPLLGAGIAALLEDDPGLVVVGTGADEDAVVAAVRREAPDVAVVDSGLSGYPGTGVCTAVKAVRPSTRVLLLHDRPDRVLLLAAVLAGADGFLTRDCRGGELVTAVHRVHRGEASIPASMLSDLLRDLVRRRRDEQSAVERFHRLSSREKQVLALLVEGLDHHRIAAELVVSPHTARTHIQNVLAKLEVHSRVEAAILVLEHNLAGWSTAPPR
jgi:DNA-binding NarL/FixJ family response regulator